MDALYLWEAVKQFEEKSERINEQYLWLITQINAMHFILCPEQTGTWKERTLQVVKAIEKDKEAI